LIMSTVRMTTSKDSTGRQPFWLLLLRETVATKAGHWRWHSPAFRQLQQAWHPRMPCCYQGSPCQHQGHPCHTPGADHTLFVSLHQQEAGNCRVGQQAVMMLLVEVLPAA